MKLELRSYVCDFARKIPRESEDVSIQIPEPHTGIFTKSFIYNKILECQQNGTMRLKWLHEGKLIAGDYLISDTSSDDYRDERFRMLKLIVPMNLLGPDIKGRSDVEIKIIPETTDEFECYFQTLMIYDFDQTVRNAVMVIPTSNCFVDYYNVKQVGDSLIVPAYRKGRIFDDDYWYVIKLADLEKSVVTVYAQNEIMQHLIGKDGKTIRATIEYIRGKGFSSLHNINLRPFLPWQGTHII